MADWYIDSAATGLNNGTSWTDAYTSYVSLSGLSDNDRVWIASTHSESTASTYNPSLANNVTVISADKTSGTPPVTRAAGASITTSASFPGLCNTTNDNIVYFWGITFENTVGGWGATGVGVRVYLDNCTFWLNHANTSRWVGPNSFAQRWVLKDCTLKFGSTLQRLNSQTALDFCSFVVDNVTIDPSGSMPSTLCQHNGGSWQVEIANSDLSGLLTTAYVINNHNQRNAQSVVRNCKVPASSVDVINDASIYSTGTSASFAHNNDDADTHTRLEYRVNRFGKVFDETTLVKTGGASNGTDSLSWRVETTTTTSFPMRPVVCPPITIWNATTGSSKTATIDFLHDSLTALTNKDIWMEVEYYGTSGVPKGSVASDRHDASGAATSNRTTSAATWTTTGMTNPNTQKLEVSFTPQEIGYIRITIFVAKPSYTVYIDPKVTIT